VAVPVEVCLPHKLVAAEVVLEVSELVLVLL
jgi:hypothetical protein